MGRKRFRLIFGKELRKAVYERGWNAKELSKAARVSEASLSKIFNGISMPTIFVIARISRVTGISVDSMLEWYEL